ncbi:MAG: DNA-binding response regulator [Spirochaetia bacterium]|nr:DNA-binding response regulator [Spirochaetia bacterium]
MGHHTVLIVLEDNGLRQGLTDNIRWESLDLELAGSTGDGKIGSKLLKLLSCDIMITDDKVKDAEGQLFLSKCSLQHTVVIASQDLEGPFRTIIPPVDFLLVDKVLQAMINKLDKVRDCQIKSVVNALVADDAIPLTLTTDNKLANKAIDYIRDNYDKNIGLQEAATFLNVSESHLSRIFRQYTGMNFLQFLNAWRVNRSVELMFNKELSVKKIAALSGFPTPGYFARIFKRFCGLTPSVYRSQLTNNNQ